MEQNILDIKNMVTEIYNELISDDDFYENQEQLDYIALLECQLAAACKEIEQLKEKNKKLKKKIKGFDVVL